MSPSTEYGDGVVNKRSWRSVAVSFTYPIIHGYRRIELDASFCLVSGDCTMSIPNSYSITSTGC